ncbi:hypothetical protein ACI1US_02576 [Leucobacter sp. BZR 635]
MSQYAEIPMQCLGFLCGCMACVVVLPESMTLAWKSFAVYSVVAASRPVGSVTPTLRQRHSGSSIFEPRSPPARSRTRQLRAGRAAGY